MAQVTLSQYIESLKRALANHDSDAAADLLSFRHSHASNQRLQVREPEQRCQEAFEQPWDELVAAHLRCIWAAGNRNFVEAYSCQALAVQAFTKAFQNMKDDNWALPIMFVLCLDLRLFAGSAEVEKAKKMHGVETGELLEKAADLIMGCFRVCASDSRAAIEVSKKWGMLNLVNQLFKIYFKINKLHLCKPLVRAIDSLQYKDEFSLAQTVTYRYYVGRKFMFDSDYKSAEKELTFAFERCHRQSKTNKRLILISLLPVKMLLGYLPSADVLKRYDLEQFGEVATAVRRGDLSGLNQVLQKYETFFIRCGIYLILEKLKVITYRNLFKKIYLLTKVHQLKVSLFVAALRWMNVDDIDADEAECIIANLIYENKVKGYISHQHQTVVVSKQAPFPPLTSVLQ